MGCIFASADRGRVCGLPAAPLARRPPALAPGPSPGATRLGRPEGGAHLGPGPHTAPPKNSPRRPPALAPGPIPTATRLGRPEGGAHLGPAPHTAPPKNTPPGFVTPKRAPQLLGRAGARIPPRPPPSGRH